MTCVAKEYDIKTKMRFLLVYNLKTFGGEGIKIWWLDFSRWGGMNKFMAGGGIPRFFQIAARGVEGVSEVLLGGILYGVVGTCGGVNLMIQTFKAKNSSLRILNIN